MVVVDRDADGVVIDRTFSSMEGGGHAAFGLRRRGPFMAIGWKAWRGYAAGAREYQNVRLMVAAEACGICLWTLEYLAEQLQLPHRSGESLSARGGCGCVMRICGLRPTLHAACCTGSRG